MLKHFHYHCLTVLFILLLHGGYSHAQPLDSVIARALRQNQQLHAGEHHRHAALQRAESVGYLPAPTLGVEFQQTPISSLNILNGSISNNLSFSQMFMLGGKLDVMRSAELNKVSVEEERQREFAVALCAELRMEYAKLWRLDRQSALFGRSVIMINNLLQAAEQRLSIQKAGYPEVLQLRAELAAETSKVHGLTFQRKATLAKLNAMMNNNDLTSPLQPELDSTLVVAAERLLVRAYTAKNELLTRNPALRRMTSMLQMTEAEKIAIQKERIPDLMVQAMLMRMPLGSTLTSASPLFLQALESPFETIAAGPGSASDWMYSLMVSITLPFAPWSIDRINAKEVAQAATVQGMQAERENMNRMLLAELFEREQMIIHALETVTSYSTQVVPLYRQSVEALLQSFQASRTGIQEILTTARMLLMKEDELLMAQEELFMNMAKLRQILGDTTESQ